MPAKLYRVNLTEDEREQLLGITRRGQSSGRKVKRSLILCKADEGLTDQQVAEALMVGPSTVGRVRQRFVEGGLERALNDLPRPGQRRKLDGKQEAHLVAVACSARAHQMDAAIACRPSGEAGVDRLHLPGDGQAGAEKNELKPWRKKEWCIPKVSAEFVACMEDVLDLYAEPYDSKRPVVCFDETSKQLVAEKRAPIPAKAGRQERFDYEYQRNGTRNLFMTCEPLAGWRHVAVTGRRTMEDFAHQMRWLSDAYPEAEKVRVVLDNLNTHRPASLYEAFEPKEARRVIQRLEFHYTPKHGSWLNMAEIEFSVFSNQCLNRRIEDEESLKREIAALETERNQAGATINWRFSTNDARNKLRRIYPAVSD